LENLAASRLKYSWGMPGLLKTVLLFILILFPGLPAFAQSQYRVSGKIIDAITREPLPAATVRIRNTQVGTTSDQQGSFVLNNIPEEQTELEIAYISYETLYMQLDFRGQSYNNLVIQLKPSAKELEAVRITGNAEGQVKAILDQKLAANIKNIVSSEQIEQFPDLNAAEVLQRIPGITLKRDQGEGRFVQLRGTPPEFTSFNINGEQIPSPEGNVRYVGLDIVSADQIEFVEVTKVLTPDMDADAIGGSVNIITKTAKSEIPEIKASFSGGYNNLRSSGVYQTQFSIAQRKGKFGYSMNGSYYLNNQGSDNLEFEYDKLPYRGSASGGDEGTNYHLLYTEMQLRHYDIKRTRTGLSGSLDYSLGESSFYLRGMYNSFTDHETRRRKIYTLDDPINDTYFTYGGIEHDLKDRTKKQEISTINLGGKNKIGITTLDYEAAYSLATEKQPDRLEILFEDPVQSIAIKIDKSDPQWPRVYFPKTSDSLAAYDYEAYELDEMLMLNENVRDRNITLKLNYEIPFSLSDGNGFLKFGTKIRNKNKSRDNVAQVYGNYYPTNPVYFGTAPELNLTTISDGFSEPDLLGQSYLIDNMPATNEVRSFYESYPQHFIYARKETMRKSYEEDYNAKEGIAAFYGMFRMDYRQLMILGGLRYEQTNIDYTGRTINLEGETFDDIVDTLTDKRTHSFFLPQFQVKYNFTDRLNLRAAVTRTFSRPNFEDVLPYRQQDRKEVKYGNPDLEYPLSLNMDVLAEYYFQKNSLISGGLFLKKIDDFVFFYVLHAYEADPTTGANKYIVELPLNGEKATVFGAEVLGQFKLEFLPGYLQNFGLYTNYTFSMSNASIFKRYPANEQVRIISSGDDYSSFFNTKETETIRLPGQAMHTMNLALFYETKKIYGKLSVNYHDAFLDRLGADKDLDEYYDAAWHLDLTTSYSLTGNLKVFADVINLTNAPLRYYIGTKSNTMKQEYYSWWGRMGIKLDF
jgi:TonB-dependent receptor